MRYLVLIVVLLGCVCKKDKNTVVLTRKCVNVANYLEEVCLYTYKEFKFCAYYTRSKLTAMPCEMYDAMERDAAAASSKKQSN